MLQRAYRALRTLGVGGVLHAARNRVIPDRLSCFSDVRPLLEAGVGLEIGGPSAIFSVRGCVPVYPVAGRIDNCNFGSQTVWEGQVVAGDTFVFDATKPAGRQHVAEAAELDFIGNGEYDYVLSSHCLEHLANPLGALKEWKRVLKNEGLLVLVVPHKDGTFDHRRPISTLEHLIQDYDSGMPESDLTHLEEILALHDLARDPEAGGFRAFAERSRRNAENRCLHHHVFDTRLAVSVIDYMGLQIRAVETFRPYHIVVVAQKLRPAQQADNRSFLDSRLQRVRRSPFPSDQRASAL